jgi:hypothetical protein
MEEETKEEDETREIYIIPQKNGNKRKITKISSWKFTKTDIDISQQLKLLIPPIRQNILQQIKIKINGYKYQDICKKIYNPEKFVDIEYVVSLFNACNLQCFYCHVQVILIYEFVRDPKQWTLERIDNSMGHNIDNTEIACLYCNLHRRTMYHERYLATKQMIIVKLT